MRVERKNIFKLLIILIIKNMKQQKTFI